MSGDLEPVAVATPADACPLWRAACDFGAAMYDTANAEGAGLPCPAMVRDLDAARSKLNGMVRRAERILRDLADCYDGVGGGNVFDVGVEAKRYFGEMS